MLQRKRKLNLELLESLLTQGKTQIEIAGLLGVTQAAVSWARKNNLNQPSARPPQKLFKEHVQKLYEDGLSQIQIGKICSISPANVSSFMTRNKIQVRDVSERQLKKDKHPSWVKENPSYGACHQRLKNIRGTPTQCESCGENDPAKKYEWASINRRYDDPSDYKRLCVLCHRRFDRLLTIPIDAILKLRSEGQTQEQIAVRFNCTRGAISKRLRAAGHFGRV